MYIHIYICINIYVYTYLYVYLVYWWYCVGQHQLLLWNSWWLMFFLPGRPWLFRSAHIESEQYFHLDYAAKLCVPWIRWRGFSYFFQKEIVYIYNWGYSYIWFILLGIYNCGYKLYWGFVFWMLFILGGLLDHKSKVLLLYLLMVPGLDSSD